MKRIKAEVGSGNVFADIGLPNPEEALAKAEIARLVNLALCSRKLSRSFQKYTDVFCSATRF
jgi:hypothetical protein